MKVINVNTILVLISLGVLCFSNPHYKGNKRRFIRQVDGTTTAEPKIGLNNTALMSSNDSVSTTMKIKTALQKDRETTTTSPYRETTSSKTTTQSIDKLQYERYTTMNQNRHTTSTTTAMPISLDISSSVSSFVPRQFDVLSFIGGSLFTFCLVGFGVLSWKAYALHIERSYRTI
ncbi:uncharacterized protein LOC123268473 [Cotesia glomerata]|uniref:Uncharacterized protein n=1 Tax=Cotesia glomerata TaxID=32391 RepID=A0AAV7I341_COTGL|nr:uncharacterized protein LOC123268473 [Cotesia glomerata]KAH0545769.1 hypothetical protein KQX54_002932 [Cotesia glomerata]